MFYSKKALSSIVVTIFLVLLVIVLIGVIWSFVDSFVQEGIDSGEACFNVLDKVLIDNENTCYNLSSSQLKFAIKRKDIELDKIIVSIENQQSAEVLSLQETSKTEDYFTNYSKGEILVMPPKKASYSYYFDTTEFGQPSRISIAPVVNGVNCEATDISSIGNCLS